MKDAIILVIIIVLVILASSGVDAWRKERKNRE